MSNITPCDCSDNNCVNKTVVEENLGFNDSIPNLSSYNGFANRRANDDLLETDRTIYDKDAASFSVVSPSATLQVGGELKLTVEPNVFTNNPPTVVWESSDTSIAQVDSDGNVFAKGAGEVTIKASNFEDTTISATTTITVS
jgi:hypothetical protein